VTLEFASSHIAAQNERPKHLFVNTDLDHQLKEHGIEKIIIIGVLANTRIESTRCFGMELGYQVTLLKDATTAFSQEAMHEVHEINGLTRAL
jgi:nicotinamidase-related amidase